eukprot:TRINITY_DN11286_c1_g1_i1.p1 TRINITY_DN11286_c1_g1~~TRINITY_DN11286_c1_g1_i1.p1  ORF type:complete len:726 (-),score=94.82 TRINITY_DN11286_c1_g1_i1:113-2164(-)
MSEITGRASTHLIGFGIEDVNHELYGGLYSQMVYGEDFEEPAGLSGVSGDIETSMQSRVSPTWAPLESSSKGPNYDGDDRPSFETVSSNVFNGKQAQLLIPGKTQPARIINRGLYQQGMHFKAGSEYEGYLYVRSAGDPQIELHSPEEMHLEVALVSKQQQLQQQRQQGDEAVSILAKADFSILGDSGWRRIDFVLRPSRDASCHVVASYKGCRSTPEGECVVCDGALMLSVSQGAIVVDFTFLQPGTWGRFNNLPVRKDVANLLHAAGVNALRLGGSTCNVDGWRWKSMRGPREYRQPYRGQWHPYASQGWRIFEFLDLCEKMGVLAVVTINNNETPEDLADLVEYAFGSNNTAWGRQRIADAEHPEPYKAFVVEIGNEQSLDYTFVQQVSESSAAMHERAMTLNLDTSTLRIAIGHNLDMAMINTPVCDAMVNATRFLGENVMWDLHTDADIPEQEDHWAATFRMATEMLDRLGSKMKLAVFEENANRHDIFRALNRARYANTYDRLGDRFVIGTAANGLQILGYNDNGWDQGALFLAPDRAWLSPFGQADALISSASESLVMRTELEGNGISVTDNSKLDILVASREDKTTLAMRVVNYDPQRCINLSLELPSGTVCARAEIATLTAKPSEVNPPSDMNRVAPVHHTADSLRALLLPHLSLTTVRWSNCTYSNVGNLVIT